MGTLIVNYHRTVSSPTEGRPHVLNHTAFDRQLELISESGVRVLDAGALCPVADDHAPDGLGITFDDGTESDLPNAEKLLARGWSAIFFVSTAKLGQAGYLDAPQLRRLSGLGMRVGSHSHEHTRLTKLDAAEARRQVMRSRAMLQDALGQPVDLFAFPGGEHSPVTVQIVRESGFRFAYGTGWGENRRLPSLGNTVLRRNNVVRGMTDRDFLELITKSNLEARKAQYLAIGLVKRIVPERAYGAIRRLLVR